jgi:hypothetical protein
VTGGPLLTLVFMAAIWPFNRDGGADEPGTIKDLESRAVEVETDALLFRSNFITINFKIFIKTKQPLETIETVTSD